VDPGQEESSLWRAAVKRISGYFADFFQDLRLTSSAHFYKSCLTKEVGSNAKHAVTEPFSGQRNFSDLG
jgi:hypothetical protein